MKFVRLGLVVLSLVIAARTFAAEDPRRLLLVGQGPDNHPPGTHEYMAGVERLAKLLETDSRIETKLVRADGAWSEGPELIENSDGLVLFVSDGAKWCAADPRRYEALTKLAARGGGLSVLHWGMGTRDIEPIEPFLKLFGACHGGPDRKYQVVRSELRPTVPAHPIAAGFKPFDVRDEFYYRLKLMSDKTGQAESPIQPVMQVLIDGQPETVAWAWERPDGGRSFGFSGLHFNDNWELPEYARLMKQGVLWTLKLAPQ
jgi:type 1 glutamine amidotransferase